MKNTIKFLGVLLITLTFNSCDDTTSLADIEFSTSLTKNVDVQIIESQVTFNKDFEIELDNDETHNYLSKIKSVAIDNFTYKFIDFTGNEDCALNNMQIIVNEVILDSRDFEIKQSADDGTVFSITDESKLSEVAALLLTNQKITLNFGGDVENGPANFKAEIKLDLTIVANPL